MTNFLIDYHRILIISIFMLVLAGIITAMLTPRRDSKCTFAILLLTELLCLYGNSILHTHSLFGLKRITIICIFMIVTHMLFQEHLSDRFLLLAIIFSIAVVSEILADRIFSFIGVSVYDLTVDTAKSAYIDGTILLLFVILLIFPLLLKIFMRKRYLLKSRSKNKLGILLLVQLLAAFIIILSLWYGENQENSMFVLAIIGAVMGSECFAIGGESNEEAFHEF